MPPQEELEKMAEDNLKSLGIYLIDRGTTAAFYTGPASQCKTAFFDGFLALQAILQKVVDEQRVQIKEICDDNGARGGMRLMLGTLWNHLHTLHAEIEKWKETK